MSSYQPRIFPTALLHVHSSQLASRMKRPQWSKTRTLYSLTRSSLCWLKKHEGPCMYLGTMGVPPMSPATDFVPQPYHSYSLRILNLNVPLCKATYLPSSPLACLFLLRIIIRPEKFFQICRNTHKGIAEMLQPNASYEWSIRCTYEISHW